MSKQTELGHSSWENHFLAGERAIQDKSYTSAETTFLLALSESEEFDLSDPRRIETLNALGAVYRHLRNFEESEKVYRKSLALTQDEFGAPRVESIPAMEGIAWNYRILRRYQETEEIYQQTLLLREKKLGPNHLEVAQSLRVLAYFYKQWHPGADGKADPEKLFRRSLEINENRLGSEHPQTVESLLSLASCLVDNKKYAESETLYRETIAIQKKILGAHHPDVATSLLNLVSVYDKQNKYTEGLYTEVLLTANGPNPLEEARILYKLAWHYKYIKQDAKKALPLFESALTKYEKVLGLEHLELTDCLDQLSSLYFNEKDFKASAIFKERMLIIDRKNLDSENPLLAEKLSGLADIYVCSDKFEEAFAHNSEALKINRAAFGPLHTKVIGSLVSLAQIQFWTGKLAEAESTYLEAEKLCTVNLKRNAGEMLLWMNFTRIFAGLLAIYEKENRVLKQQIYLHKKQVLGVNSPQGFKDLADLYASEEESSTPEKSFDAAPEP